MSKSKQKGTMFETAIVNMLRHELHTNSIERRALNGTKDRGDISGVTFCGQRMVVECKNQARMNLSEYFKEARDEAMNDNATYWVVIHKRPRVSVTSNMTSGEQYATLPAGLLARMINTANYYYEQTQKEHTR